MFFWFYFCNVDYFVFLVSLDETQKEEPEAAAALGLAFNVIKDRKFKHRPA